MFRRVIENGETIVRFTRFLVRSATWALAAVGVKSLYDRLAPKASDLREPTSQVLGTAKRSSRELAEHAKAAGAEVLTDARDRSAEIRDVATDALAKVDATAKPAPAETVDSKKKSPTR